MTPSDDDRPLEPARLGRLEALLAGLERVDAPAALRLRLESALGDDDAAAASRVTTALARLDARRAPEHLRTRVERTLAPDEDELARRAAAGLDGLAPLTAPDALRERVRLELSTATPVARLVGDLERQRVPAVLERLVAEEAVDEKAVARRFVGSLPKPGAPEVLRTAEPRVAGGRVLRGGFGGATRFAAAAALLLGAGVVLWTSASSAPRPDRPSFRLEHRVVDSVDALGSGLAAELAVALGLPAGEPERATDGGTGSGSTSDRSTTDGGGR